MLRDESEAYRTLEAAPSNVCDVGHFKSWCGVTYVSCAGGAGVPAASAGPRASGSDIAGRCSPGLRMPQGSSWYERAMEELLLRREVPRWCPRRCRLRMSRCHHLAPEEKLVLKHPKPKPSNPGTACAVCGSCRL